MAQQYKNIATLLEGAPEDQTIKENLIVAWDKINSPKYSKIFCATSGGSDSDIMIDILSRCDKDKKVKYIWFNTGLEYEATKNHLRNLEEKYDITIEEIRPEEPIPYAVKKYGVPFMNKYVSEMMERLQRHNFMWRDEDYETLVKKYPKCITALKWWCNKNPQGSMFNIDNNRFLKEFIISNPPDFSISNKCCTKSKKNPAKKLIKKDKYDLQCVGVRKSEGGTRINIKSCFSEGEGCDQYRPVFWYTPQTKSVYNQHYNVKHSDCYNVYGLKRTGCVGCPFGRNYEDELKTCETYEPQLYKACLNVFGKSYEYTKLYKEFVENIKNPTKKT